MIDFNDVYETAGKNCLVPESTHVLYEWLKETELVEGDICEIGVFKGGSAKFIHTCFPKKKLFLIDTFIGIVRSDINKDWHKDSFFLHFAGDRKNKNQVFFGTLNTLNTLGIEF